MDQRPILIIEDDPVIRELLHDALSVQGYTTVAVTNGLDALTALRFRRPAVVLLDLSLPFVDGEDLLRQIRTEHPGAPVLLLTADPRGDRLTFADGVWGHIPKPFDLDDLVLAIDMVTSPTAGTWDAASSQA